MSETLHTCPTCETQGFTARGLKTHKCKGVNRSAGALVDADSGELVHTEPSSLTAEVSRQIHTINEHWRSAEHHAQQSCAHFIMAGHQLLDLKKQTKHGEWGNLFGDGKLKHEFQFGFSQQWANRLMTMAKASREQLPELQSLPFEKPLGKWDAEELQTLGNVVAKRADGETFQQLAFEWGVAKKPATKLGGDTSAHRKDKPSGKTDAQLRIEDARAAFNKLMEDFRSAVQSGHLDDLPEDEVKALQDFLRTQLDQVKARLKSL